MKFEHLYVCKDVAVKHGIIAGVLLAHFAYWCNVNAENGNNEQEGRHWTYNTAQAFQSQFPWWSVKQVRSALGVLVNAGLLLKGTFNKKAFDHTAWYSLTDKAWKLFPDRYNSPQTVDTVHFPCGENRDVQKGYSEVNKRDTSKCTKGINPCVQKGYSEVYKRDTAIPNKDTIKDANKDAYDDAPASASSFSSSRKPFNLSPSGNERPDLDLPCEDDVTMYFTEDDITDLRNAYIGVDVISEIRKMILQAKQIGKRFTLDRTRKRVYVWLGNAQNKVAADTTISQKVYHIDPSKAQPKRPKSTAEILAEMSPEVRNLIEGKKQ